MDQTEVPARKKPCEERKAQMEESERDERKRNANGNGSIEANVTDFERKKVNEIDVILEAVGMF